MAADRAGDGLLARAALHAQAVAAGGAAEILVGLHALQAGEELPHLPADLLGELDIAGVFRLALANIAAQHAEDRVHQQHRADEAHRQENGEQRKTGKPRGLY